MPKFYELKQQAVKHEEWGTGQDTTKAEMQKFQSQIKSSSVVINLTLQSKPSVRESSIIKGKVAVLLWLLQITSLNEEKGNQQNKLVLKIVFIKEFQIFSFPLINKVHSTKQSPGGVL